MSVEGELSEFELSRILELLCLQRHRVAVWLHRDGEEGAILVGDGQVVHASLGTLQGELQGAEAAYRMLSWSTGTFRIARSSSRVPATIEISWNHLLLEGARRIDEGRRSNAPGPAAKSTHLSPSDQAWVLELLTLASRLERVVDAIRTEAEEGRPAVVLDKIEELISQTVEFGHNHDLFDPRGRPLLQILAEVGELHPEVGLGSVLDGRLTLELAIGSYRSETDAKCRGDQGRSLCDGLILILRRCLETLGSRFDDGALAAEWAEAYTVLVTDISDSCRTVEF